MRIHLARQPLPLERNPSWADQPRLLLEQTRVPNVGVGPLAHQLDVVTPMHRSLHQDGAIDSSHAIVSSTDLP